MTSGPARPLHTTASLPFGLCILSHRLQFSCPALLWESDHCQMLLADTATQQPAGLQASHPTCQVRTGLAVILEAIPWHYVLLWFLFTPKKAMRCGSCKKWLKGLDWGEAGRKAPGQSPEGLGGTRKGTGNQSGTCRGRRVDGKIALWVHHLGAVYVWVTHWNLSQLQEWVTAPIQRAKQHLPGSCRASGSSLGSTWGQKPHSRLSQGCFT